MYGALRAAAKSPVLRLHFFCVRTSHVLAPVSMQYLSRTCCDDTSFSICSHVALLPKTKQNKSMELSLYMYSLYTVQATLSSKCRRACRYCYLVTTARTVWSWYVFFWYVRQCARTNTSGALLQVSPPPPLQYMSTGTNPDPNSRLNIIQ